MQSKELLSKFLLTALTIIPFLYCAAIYAADCETYRYHPSSDPVELPQADSFLLEVSYQSLSEQRNSYIFASFHSAAPQVLDQWSGLSLLLADKPLRIFISERDLLNNNDLDQQWLAKPQTLPDLLLKQTDLYSQIVSILKPYRFSEAQITRIKPWFASALLNQVAALTQDKNARIIDEYLLTMAASLNINTRFLETFADIADYYEQHFTLAEQIQLLWEAVCNQTVLKTLTEQQTQAFASNEVSDFYRLLHKFEGNDKTISDKLVDIFVTQRNKKFWSQLWPEIEQGQAFIVVGSLHVFGKGGLLERLNQQQGITINAIDSRYWSSPELDSRLLSGLNDWLLRWLENAGISALDAASLADVQIQHRSLQALRQLLCPGKSCKIESTYIAEQKQIILTNEIFTRLLAQNQQPQYDYASSLLIRELSRHALQQIKEADWQQRLNQHPRSAECIKSTILHHSSLAQAAYLRAQHSNQQAHIFSLDPRCPTLSL